MGRKNWATLNEEMLHRGFASLAFLRQYTNEKMGQRGIRLSQGRFSKLLLEQHFVQHVSSDGQDARIYYCLGNGTWAGLAWPVKEFTHGGQNFNGLYLDPAGECQWIFMLDPSEWRVLTTSATIVNNQIFMILQESHPLLKYYFGKASRLNNLLVVDLQMIGDFVGLSEQEMKRLKKKDLIHKLLDIVGGEDCEFIAKVKADLEKPEKPTIIGDALDEFVLGELPLEDQGDFKNVADVVESRKKAGWAMVENKWKQSQKKRKLPKAKAKAKAKSVAPKRKPAKLSAFAKKQCIRKRKAEASATWHSISIEFMMSKFILIFLILE